MSTASRQYTDESKAEAAKSDTEKRFAVAEVANRLGISSRSIYPWLRRARREVLAGTPEGALFAMPMDSVEVRRLKVEVKRLA